MRSRISYLLVLLGASAVLSVGCDSSGDDAESTGSDEREQSEEETRTEQSSDTESTSTEDGGTSDSSDARLAGDYDEPPPFRAVDAVAEIDGDSVSAETFNSYARWNSAQGRETRERERVKEEYLDRFIEHRLAVRASEEAGVDVSSSEVDGELEEFREEFPDDAAFHSFLKSRATSIEDLRERLKADLRLEKLLRKRGEIDVSEEDARSYYEDNSDEFSNSEKVKASHILIKTGGDGESDDGKSAKQRAEEIAKQARKEETSFEELAREHSDGPSGQEGGDLGYFTRDRMVEAFSERAFSMENGEISDPVKTKFGYHVIKRVDHKPERKQAFDEVRDEIVEKLEKRQIREAVRKFNRELKADATVERFPENIEFVERETSSADGADTDG